MNIRRLNSSLHRDIGFFLSGLILVYCVSGIALNHAGDWNPDFMIHKETIDTGKPHTRDEVTLELIAEFTALVGESPPKVHDFPTPNHVKIYYDNATLLVDLPAKKGVYEKVRRRHFIYQTNVLHRNSVKGWKWVSDIFGGLLAFLTVSGWFLVKGRDGIAGRGKWLVAAGMLPPVAAVIVFELVQK